MKKGPQSATYPCSTGMLTDPLNFDSTFVCIFADRGDQSVLASLSAQMLWAEWSVPVSKWIIVGWACCFKNFRARQVVGSGACHFAKMGSTVLNYLDKRWALCAGTRCNTVSMRPSHKVSSDLSSRWHLGPPAHPGLQSSLTL